MKNKKEAFIVAIMLIYIVLSFLMFDFSFAWVKEFTFQSVFIIALTIIFAILLSKVLKNLNQRENEKFFDGLIFMIISFLLVLLSNIGYDGTRSNNLLDNVVFPVVIFSGSVSSLILLFKRHNKTKAYSKDDSLDDSNNEQSGDGSLIDKK